MEFLRIRTRLPQAELRRRLDGLDAVAFGVAAAGSAEEIRLAAHLAEKASSSGRGIARKTRYEFLLWLSGKRDIRSAMEKLAPAEGERGFFVAVFSGAGEKEVLAALEAEKMPLGLSERGEPLALERISLSRLKG